MPRAFFLAVQVLFALPVLADGLSVARLGGLLEGMRSIESAFNQQLRDEKSVLIQESSGRVVLAHPGRFRWETAPPFEQLVVSDGRTVWQYDPDLAQVVVRPLDKRADQVPSMLLAGDVAAVDKLYTITTAQDDAGTERFELTPRDDGSPFSHLALQFRGGRLERLEITDGLGQRTEVSFSGVKPIADPDPSLFVFRTPEGVDEIRDE